MRKSGGGTEKSVREKESCDSDSNRPVVVLADHQQQQQQQPKEALVMSGYSRTVGEVSFNVNTTTTSTET